MQLGMIGLGRMGGNIVRRLMKDGHSCVVYDRSADAMRQLSGEGATPSQDLADFVGKLSAPKAVWVMLPAGEITHNTIVELNGLMSSGDIVIDGGNSFYHDDIKHSDLLKTKGIRYIDVGTSGGIWGLERGYCMMIGGDKAAVDRLDLIFKTIAPGAGDIEKTPGREGRDPRVENGYIYCGPAGSGHFVKMVHNGIEYGIMAAYAEGLGVLKAANIGKRQTAADAETTPLRDP
ncbi:MAG: NADP-dependent phosphogluconate dehydrogenase, partial [Stellaceae bacterium]